MDSRPAEHASWPLEVRALYDAVADAHARLDHVEGARTLDHFVALARHDRRQPVAAAARGAFLELALRYAPEQVLAVMLLADRVISPGLSGPGRPVTQT